MKGWSIFVHSVRLVFTNIDAALRISLVLYLIYAVAQFWLLRTMPQAPVADAGPTGLPPGMALPSGGMVAGSFLSALVTLIVSVWIAVAWHRYVLLEELPRGWVPPFHGGLMLGYFGRSILLGLLVLIVVLVIMIPIGLVIAASGSAALGFLGTLVGLGVGFFVFYRLCPILPAGAMGQPIRLGRAWEATRGSGGAVLVLVLLTLIASLILEIPTYVGGNPDSAISTIYSLAVGWFMMLVGISVLTTFYGHYVEGRSID